MARSKKSISVREVVQDANMFFVNSSPDKKDIRHYLHVFVSNILHRTNNYRGFSYLESAGVKNPCTPQLTIEDDTRIKFTLPPE